MNHHAYFGHVGYPDRSSIASEVDSCGRLGLHCFIMRPVHIKILDSPFSFLLASSDLSFFVPISLTERSGLIYSYTFKTSDEESHNFFALTKTDLL